MKIKYVGRSQFLEICKSTLVSQEKALFSGKQIHISLKSGGYNDELIVVIDNSDRVMFETDWFGSDPTRFPARIKAAATALLHLGYSGNFKISHNNGLLTVQLLSVKSSETQKEEVLNTKTDIVLESKNERNSNFLILGLIAIPIAIALFLFSQSEDNMTIEQNKQVKKQIIHNPKDPEIAALQKKKYELEHRVNEQKQSKQHKADIKRKKEAYEAQIALLEQKVEAMTIFLSFSKTLNRSKPITQNGSLSLP